MSARNDGGSAFPLHYGITREAFHPGMSLRDYFAIHATNEDLTAFMGFGDQFFNTQDRCAARYAYADAMLVERAKAEGKAP